MEVDDAFHADVRQVGKIDHKARHDVEHVRKFLVAINWYPLSCESTHRGILQRKIFKEYKDARDDTEDNGEDLHRAQCSELHAFWSMEHFLLQKTLLDSDLQLLWASESISHRGKTNVQSETHHKLAVRSVTASLDNVLRLDFEGCRVIDLLEVSSEVALVVVLPFDQTTDRICKLRVAHVAASLVHSTLIAAFESWRLKVVPETASLVTRLVVHLGADDVEDESIARNLLIRLDLYNISSLDAAPVGNLEAFVPLGKDEFFHRLTIHFLSSLLEFLVMQQVEAACGHDTGNCYEGHMRVVSSVSLARDSLRAEVHQQNHMIKLKDGFVEEYSHTPESSVVVEDEGVLILMEVVQGALGDAIFDLDAAFDILLVGELNLG